MAELNELNEQRNRSNNQQMKWQLAKIPQILGEGETAKHSIVYLVLKWAFVSGTVITIFVIINYWLFRDCDNKVPAITDDLKVIWEIVTPIITLTLGYEFGKWEKQ